MSKIITIKIKILNREQEELIQMSLNRKHLDEKQKEMQKKKNFKKK